MGIDGHEGLIMLYFYDGLIMDSYGFIMDYDGHMMEIICFDIYDIRWTFLTLYDYYVITWMFIHVDVYDYYDHDICM